MSHITVIDEPTVTYRVLVVDDDQQVCSLVRACLERAGGLEVCGVAADAEGAIRLARDQQPDVVVLDHNLGSATTGLDVAMQLRDVVPDSHIVMFSAFLSDDDSFEAVDAVFNKDKLMQLAGALRRLVGIDKHQPGPAMPCPECGARIPLARADVTGDSRELTCDRCGVTQRWTVPA